MKWLYNVRISRKFLFASLAALSLAICAGVYFMIGLLMENAMRTEVERKWVPGVRITSGMNLNVSDFRMFELRHVLSDDENDMARCEQDMTRLRKEIDLGRVGYEALVSSAEERHDFDAFNMKWQAYLIEHDKVLALSRSSKSDAMSELFRSDSKRYFDEASDALFQLMKFNLQGSKTADRQGGWMNQKFAILIVGIMASAAVPGVGLALLSRRLAWRGS